MADLVSTSNFFESTDLLPAMNIGGGMDIPSGRIVPHPDGGWMIDGGLSPITGVCGDGNTYKSTLSSFFSLSALNRYGNHWATNLVNHIRPELMVYDTEFSKKISRYEDLSCQYKYLFEQDLPKNVMNPDGIIIITNGKVGADDYFEGVKQWGDQKANGAKSQYWYTTPFKDVDGNLIKMPVPTINEWDSLSMARADAMAAQFNDLKVADSKNNTEAMRDGMVKNRIVMRMQSSCTISSMYTILVAHLGKEIQMDARMPPAKQMAFLKQHIKFKNVPEKFKFLPNNLYMTSSPQAHWHNTTTKTVRYPRHANDNITGDTDLQRINVVNLRGKSGPSGLPFEVIVSQRDGFQPSLTEHHHCLGKKMYGMTGKDITAHTLDLIPEVKLTRTTVRSIFLEQPLVMRAMEITMELCQMKYMWLHIPVGFILDPKEILEVLTKKGFDMNILLNTRGWWIFEDIKHPLFRLSTWDLLQMCHTDYKPFWYDGEVKRLAKIKLKAS